MQGNLGNRGVPILGFVAILERIDVTSLDIISESILVGVVMFITKGATQIQLWSVGHNNVYVGNKMPASMVQSNLRVCST